MGKPKSAKAGWRRSRHSGPNANCIEVAAVWRKSTHSGSNADCVEVAPVWRTSTHSGSNSACVQAASGVGHVAVRDSKNPTGAVLLIEGAQWTAFLDAIKNGPIPDQA